MGSIPVLCLALLVPVGSGKRAPRRVEIVATPALVVLGGEGPQAVDLDVRVSDTRPGRLADADVILHTTAGEVVGLREVAPGRFTARLQPPAQRFPQLAVVSAADLSEVALAEPPVLGTAMVAYSARTSLNGRAEPNATMEVQIGARRYGPVRADHRGHFAIPVTVKPGERFAEGISRDDLGNTSQSRINMYLPEVRRMHGFAYPRELVADGADAGWLFVATVSHVGAPENVPIRVRADRGTVGRPVRIGRGLFRVEYRAPLGVGDGHDSVSVVSRRGKATLDVHLMAGAPARLDVGVEPHPVLADGASEAIVDINVWDGSDNPVAAQNPNVAVDGVEVPVSRPAPGRYRSVLPGRAAVGSARLRIEVHPASRGCRRGRLVRGTQAWHVVDARGVGCAGAYRVIEPGDDVLFRGQLGDGGTVPDSSALLRAVAAGARLELEDAEPRRIAVHAGARPTAGVEVAKPLVWEREVWWQPPAPVGLRIRETRRDADRVHLRVEAHGVQRARERLRVNASAGLVTVVGEGDGYLDVEITGANLPVEIIVTDSETGIGTWARVR
jgi:hypothetical protein